MRTIIANSEAEFCRRHGIAARTLRYHKSKGANAVEEFLIKRGILEKLPQDGASIDCGNPLMERHSAATSPERGGGPKASRPEDEFVIYINTDDLEAQLEQADLERPKPSSARAILWQRVVDKLRQDLAA